MSNLAFNAWTEKDFNGSIPGQEYFGRQSIDSSNVGGYVAQPNDALTALQSINALMASLAVRLAPPVVNARININVAIGSTSPPITIAGKAFNGIIVNVWTGVIKVYIGAPSQSSLLYQFQASTNPFPLPLPPRDANGAQFYIECIAASPADATGVIDIIQY